jgi:hypothetical protein
MSWLDDHNGARAVYVAAGLGILAVTLLLPTPRAVLADARTLLLPMRRSAGRLAPGATQAN